MKSLYDSQNLQDILQRIESINPNTKPLWGKMNASQMFEHCARGLDYAVGNEKSPRMVIGYLLGGLMKASYYNDKLWGPGAPTSKSFTVTDSPEFEKTKQRLINLVKQFSTGGPEKATTHPSPFFGKLTPQQHGLGQFKHIDHHLRQFGV